MAASHCVVMASGTTTLEAMLLKRPMVILYKWPTLTWHILSRLVKVPWVGLPNLLCKEEIAPELLQEKATVANIVAALSPIIESDELQKQRVQRFTDIHRSLKKNASVSAAQAIAERWNHHA